MPSQPLFATALLVEDESAHALLIKRAATGLLGQVTHVASFAEAQALLAGGAVFDLIITDLNLPDSSAARHIEPLRTLGRDAPIVVLTASTSLQDAVEAMRRGAVDFLVKNFDSSFKDIFGLALEAIASRQAELRETLRLQREMEVLRIAIENGNDGMAIADLAGRVIYANGAFAQFAARCGGELSDLSAIFGSAVARAERLRGELAEKLRDLPPQAVWQTEASLAAEPQTAYSVRLSIIASSQAGSAPEAVLWVRDISEQKRREKFQREILSTTTHDLKGPLGAILISTELLGDMLKDQKKASDLVVRVASSAQNALNLIEELLSARRIQEGGLILRPVEADLRERVEETVAANLPIAASRGIALSTNLPPQEVRGMVDRLGFERVLGNLLSNALKFTPKGGTVRVSLGSAGDETFLLVEDSGPGIEASEVQRLFQRYSRLEKHREVAGSGLGLFVVRSIVAAHGGRIEVTSKVGQGTAFRMLFPRQPPVNERGELICLDFG